MVMLCIYHSLAYLSGLRHAFTVLNYTLLCKSTNSSHACYSILIQRDTFLGLFDLAYVPLLSIVMAILCKLKLVLLQKCIFQLRQHHLLSAIERQRPVQDQQLKGHFVTQVLRLNMGDTGLAHIQEKVKTTEHRIRFIL